MKNFCNQYNITLTIDYQETSDYASGTILSQSRSSDTPIVSGTTLKITVATEPTDSGKPADDEEEDKPKKGLAKLFGKRITHPRQKKIQKMTITHSKGSL